MNNIADTTQIIGPVIFIVAVIVAYAVLKEMTRSDPKRNREKRRPPYARPKPVADTSYGSQRTATTTGDQRTLDAADQLRKVMMADFKARPVFNQKELRLFRILEEALQAESPGWRAMGQVNLGEILSTPSKPAFFSVNSKRVDILLVDKDSNPLHAVEFQGKGHHRSADTAARDAVKKEALRRAGIGYVEVVTGDTPAEVRQMVRKLVGRAEV